MIELFHGGCESIDVIDLSKCRPHRDFGRGFYLTSIEEHAKDRADHKARIYGTPPVVTSFKFDERKLSDNSLKVLRFETESPEWAEFIYRNREDESFSHDYDIVVGPIADDGLRDLLRKIKRGEISFQELSDGLVYRKKSIQFCFCTEESLKALINL